MADNVPIRETAFSFKLGLPSVAFPGIMQSGPTLATGDVKVSIDGGSLTNITTLPTASGKIVTVSLSAAEMTGDSIVVQFSDAAGTEWKDVLVEIRPQRQDGVRVAATQDLLPKYPATIASGDMADIPALRAAKIDNLDVLVSTRSSHTASDVWAVTTRRLSDANLSGGGVLANTANADTFKADVSGLLTDANFDTALAALQTHGDNQWTDTGAGGDATEATSQKILDIVQAGR